jgi:hypothetical protein
MSGLIASGPSKQYGSGGMVTRMSFAAIAMTASASNRSCAAMNCSTSSRSSALGSPADHSARRAGRCDCIGARARCWALLAAATLVPSAEAVWLAGQPRTSRAISAARCLGGSACRAARNASEIVSRWMTTASGCSSLGAAASSSRSGYGWSHGTSGGEFPAVRREPRRSMSRQTLVAIRYSHARNCGPPSKPDRPHHAFRNVSCTASSASSNEASIR